MTGDLNIEMRSMHEHMGPAEMGETEYMEDTGNTTGRMKRTAIEEKVVSNLQTMELIILVSFKFNSHKW